MLAPPTTAQRPPTTAHLPATPLLPKTLTRQCPFVVSDITCPALDFCTLDYRADLRILFVRWLRPTTLAEVQASYEAALVLARQHNCPDWLLDARRTGPINVEETAWLADHFFPSAAAGFAPRPLRLAVFSSPQRIEQLRTDAKIIPATTRALSAARPYQASVFADEQAAVVWLRPVVG